MEYAKIPVVIKQLQDEYYKPVMFYNTTLRNVGLFSSISLTVMAVAAGSKHQSVKLMLRILALLLLLVSADIIYGLHTTFEDMKSNSDVHAYMQHWNYITYGVAFIVGIMIVYDVYKLYTEQMYMFTLVRRNL